ncbi:MAG: hypothetical protein LKI17_06880 [Megasphaera cerevisiae]|jgi:hypothetical protein|nr:hypothetical protein [Megasphaera cerevisiae]
MSLRGPQIQTNVGLGTSAEANFCEPGGEGMWYYDSFRKHSSGPTIYRELLQSATDKIWIWDSYLHRGDADLFRNISKMINIRILTSFGRVPNTTNIPKEYQDFVSAISTMQQQYEFGLQLAFINLRNVGWNSAKKLPHDRFLFIDNKVYIVGSSMEYHSVERNDDIRIKSIANTLIYEIKEESNRKILHNDFKSFWETPKNQYIEFLIDKGGLV